MEQARKWVRDNFSINGFALALFLTAGYFKGDPRLAWVPVDLTLFMGVVVAALCGVELVKYGLRIPLAVLWIMSLWMCFTPALFWTTWHDYAVDKTVAFYSLTTLGMVAPLFLARERDDVRRFFNALSLLSITMALDAGSALLFSEATLQRLTAFGSNTIALGRASGVALLWLLVGLFAENKNRRWTWPLLGLLAGVLVASGSRGPVISVVICVTLLMLLISHNRLRDVLRLLVSIGVLGAVIGLTLQVLPEVSVARLESFLNGSLGHSELLRLDYYAGSWDLIRQHPLGIGWGGFASSLGSYGGTIHEYPHNIILEVMLEEGWLPALYLVTLTVIGLGSRFVRAKRNQSVVEIGLVLLLLFAFLNACVSGDFNDNRLFFCLLAISLNFRKITPIKSPAVNEGV